jgi:uncharacterized protein (TIGR03086 family)
MTPVEQLEQLIPALTDVVDRIWFTQMEAPTPCANFNVHDVIDHMIVGGGGFAPMFRGEAAEPVTPPAVYGWVPAAEFAATMKDLLEAVQSPGALTRSIDAPFGTVDGDTFARFVAFDALVHGWDLARATGQVWAPSNQLVAEVDSFARQAIAPAMRDGDTFCEPTDPGSTAGPLEQLIAFSGRTV